ncbi:MAG TPA: hypothetical protein VNV66_11985 [Pilimelia sp.]|nr:hypothetical protein [Pilimelia sp.]
MTTRVRSVAWLACLLTALGPLTPQPATAAPAGADGHHAARTQAHHAPARGVCASCVLATATGPAPPTGAWSSAGVC